MRKYILSILFIIASASPVWADQEAFFVEAMSTEIQARAEEAKNQLKPFGNAQICNLGSRYLVRIGPIEEGKKAIYIRNIIVDMYPDAIIGTSHPAPAEFKSTRNEVTETKEKASVAGTKTVTISQIASVAAAQAAPVSVAHAAQVADVSSVSGKDVIQAGANEPSAALQTTPHPANSDAPGKTESEWAPEALLKEAADHYRSGRYENALQRLSLFLSLYPSDGNVPTALFSVAAILLDMKRPMPALRIYSRILERYPGSPEAMESIMALGDMSVITPGLKPCLSITGAQWYLDPVAACDTLLSRNPPAEMTERLLFRRIFALRMQGRHRESYDAGIHFLQSYPTTKHRHELMVALRTDAMRLIEEYGSSGNDETAVSLAAKALRQGLIKMNDTDILIKTAQAYARLGLPDEAVSLLNSARKFAAANLPRIDAVLEELKPGSPTPAPPPEIATRWSLFEEGRRQIRSSNLSAAEKTFAQLKTPAQDEFWSKLSDFTLQDGIWMNKYRDYVNINKPVH
jgi:TolA-binding protein